ncbi:MAG: secretion protein, partial [Paramuribaculum sp.]|nr:secretion protein [Paramuribaculum sp.]
YMAERNPIFENVWYAGTTDGGSISFDTGVHSSFANVFRNASMFLNYNWNNSSTIVNSIAYAKAQNRNPFFIYAGMNQQGGEPKSGDNYPVVANYQYSIGVWGAHNYNMFWQGRTGGGAALSTVQRYYLNMCEQWFTNGKRNPAIKMPITTNRAHRASDDFAGMSSMMSARSVLNWDLKDEPFITYFNMGNGTFFNWHGERVSEKPWYNIGIQDYLPTWRWWFAPTFLQKDVTEGTTHLSADMTWDDAYFGGSCLQITGTTTEEYLHLFKSEFKITSQATIRVRYKLVEGEGDVALVMSNKGTEGELLSFAAPTAGKTNVLATVATSEELRTKSLEDGAEGWQTIEYKVTAAEANRAFKNPLAVIGLQVKNARNLKLLLGEFSILPNTSFTTPAAPNITLSKTLYSDLKGIDAKVVWEMPNTKSVGEPVYNSDVNRSMLKVYAQEEVVEPVFMTATTSWAAIAYAAPNTDDAKKIRFGVSAVSTDMTSESAISWSEYLEKGEYTMSDELTIDKSTIKVNESFKLGYVDPRHSSSTFKLYNTNNQLVASGEGVSLEVPEGLGEIGGYDLVVDEGTAKEVRHGYFVQISSDIVGALPEIYTLTADGSTVDENSSAVSIALTDTPTLGYTGRDADGVASRAIKLNNGHIGGSNSQFGIQARQSFTIAGWFKFDEFPADKGWSLMNITNKNGAWPNSNWGWCWSSVDKDGNISFKFRGNETDSSSPGEHQYTFPKTKLSPGAWTHLAFVCEYATQGFRFILYVNGVAQESNWVEYQTWNSGTLKSSGKNDEFCAGRTYAIASTDDLILVGVLYQESAVDGIIDDMQIWTKALTADEV